MTILAAAKTDSGVWVGADSRHVGNFPPNQPSPDAWGVTVEKLFPLGDRLVWGWYGDGGNSGRLLEDFMKDLAPRDWNEAEQVTLHRMLDLHLPPAFGLLIAGYIGTEGRIIHHGDTLNTLGTIQDALFCGYCKMAALTAWRATTAVAPDLDTEVRFDAVMESVIRTSGDVLSEPRVLWRITPDTRVQVLSTSSAG